MRFAMSRMLVFAPFGRVPARSCHRLIVVADHLLHELDVGVDGQDRDGRRVGVDLLRRLARRAGLDDVRRRRPVPPASPRPSPVQVPCSSRRSPPAGRRRRSSAMTCASPSRQCNEWISTFVRNLRSPVAGETAGEGTFWLRGPVPRWGIAKPTEGVSVDMSHDATVKRHGRRASRRLLGAVVGTMCWPEPAPPRLRPSSTRPRRVTRASASPAGVDDATAGKAALGLQHLSNTPEAGGRQRHELGHGLPGRLRVQRQLQRRQHLQHREPGRSAAGDVDRLPRQPERRVGVQEPAVHVRRGDAAQEGLHAARRRPRPRRASAASASSTSRTSTTRFSSTACRPAVARTRTRSCARRTTRTTSTSTSPARRASARRPSSRAATRRQRGRPNPSLWRIEVIKVPLANPNAAAVVTDARLFKNEETGAVNGLQNGPTHAEAPVHVHGAERSRRRLRPGHDPAEQLVAEPEHQHATTSPSTRRSTSRRAPAPATAS